MSINEKKGNPLDKQLCFNLSTGMVVGKQNLKLTSAKIMKTVIMQIDPEDKDFTTYWITIPELSKILNISRSNLYRNMDGITDDILTKYISIDQHMQGKFTKIPWVAACTYENGTGLALKMNPLLKPFFLELQQKYTPVQLENILAMKSIYAIRIYELLQIEKAMRLLPRDGTFVVLTVKEIRQACGCEDKYTKISQFKAKVIDIAVKEIVRCTAYNLSYECLKSGRSIDSLRFCISLKYQKE